MARAPLLQLADVSLTFGGTPLFSDLSLVVHAGDRVALVGRNGSGKSTLMKMMAGEVAPDHGTRAVPADVHVARLSQVPDLAGHRTLGDFAAARLAPGEEYRVDVIAEELKFDPATAVANASGGEIRRAALAALLAEAPDLMLLDEPTNHLDIAAIEWLEERLAATRTAFVLVSHDRALLEATTNAVLWLDRGRLRLRTAGFRGFEDWREAIWAEEERAGHKLDRRIRAEAKWAVEGISARRRRNMGRVRRLQQLRAERAAMIRRAGTAALGFDGGPLSGRRVIEARGLSLQFGDRPILRDFSLRVLRGDRIAIIGPNGVGKTTLLNVLLGRMAPDRGEVTLGTNLEIAVFDQNRAALDPEASLWSNLTLDPMLAVSGASDQVMVRGRPRHVVGYLRDFLFDEAQARMPAGALSGGEQARLLLARLMARPANLLVLDEPTNDLDIETLDLLQDVLGDFDGTVLFTSHDRDFIDRVATTVVAFEGDGRVVVCPGGWSDYLRERRTREDEHEKSAPPAARKPPKTPPMPTAPARQPGLTLGERKRLADLPALMSGLEHEIARLAALLADPELYARDPVKFRKAGEMLAIRQEKLAAAEAEWLLLAEKDETG